MLLLLLVPSVLSQGVTTPASPTFPFEDIEDPNAQCVDILCYEPITWSDDKKEVCRFRKEKTCKPVTKEVCMEVPETECELVGYTECDSTKNSMPARDDKVVGEFFYEQDCSTRPITVTEMKMQPECVDQKKNSCEKMWIPEAPFWKDVNCQELTWQNCTLQPHPHPVQIDYCDCKPTEIWYNKFEKVDSECEKETTSCVEKAVPVCKSKPVTKCTTVSWEECSETCEDECSMMHFKEPSQEPDHRRWCSHVEIVLPPGVNRVPPRGGRKLTSKQLPNKLPASNFSTSKHNTNQQQASTPASSPGNFRRVGGNPDIQSSFTRSGPVSNRRSSIPQNFQSRQPVRQSQQIRG